MTCPLPAATAPPRMLGTGSLRLNLHLPLAFLFFALAGGPSPAQEAPDWSDVAALFVERCVMCHSGEHAALELHLDSYEGARAGSKNGPVLVPGDVSASELVRRVRGESQPRMPFLSYPLSADEIALIERWVEAGLPEGKAAATEPLPAVAADTPEEMEGDASPGES